MKLIMEFVIGEDGYPVRYGESDEKKMTPAQRVTYRLLRGRYHAIQDDLADRQHEQDARAAEQLLQSGPKLRRVV